MVDLPVSPHYWNPKTLIVTLLEGVKIVIGGSKGVQNGELQINMAGLTKSNTYTGALEWYQKDEWNQTESKLSHELFEMSAPAV